jgi:hypothetical protein
LGARSDHLDDTDEGGRAVHHGSGAAQHLDALDVAEVERRDRGIEGAAPRNAVDDEEVGIELAEGPTARGRPRRVRRRRPARCRRRGELERAAQVARALVAQVLRP